MYALFAAGTVPGSAGRESLLPTAEALNSAREIVFDELRKGSWLHSNFLINRLVRDVARARNGCPVASLKDAIGGWFFLKPLHELILERLVDGSVLEARAVETVEFFDLLAVPEASGEWVHLLTPEGWRSIDPMLYSVFAAAASTPLPAAHIREGAARELNERGVDASSYADQAFDLFWSNGLLRSRRGTVTGDPRPALYLQLDSQWREHQSQWHERAIDSARATFSPNPYAPHLLAVVGWVPTLEEARVLPWAVRMWQLPEFDTATIVWDVTHALSIGAELVATARVLNSACAAAGLRMRLLVRERNLPTSGEWQKSALALSVVAEAPVVFEVADDGPRDADLLNAAPAWNLIFAAPDAALRFFETSDDPSFLARCYASLLTTSECGAGDTVTITMTSQSPGCPLCASGKHQVSTGLVGRARAILKERARSTSPRLAPPYTPPGDGEEPYGRRSCV
jgi:hypothetical protein